jgi:predicted amidophosphoribosyltransferase
MLPKPGQRRTISRSEHRLAPQARSLWTAATLPLSALTFASCYIYSPRATGPLAEASRELCKQVKSSDPLWLPRYAGFVYRSSLRDRQLAELFASNTLLVPVPGSRPDAAPWAAFRLAVALSRVGFALRIWPGLWRRYAVTKSATAPSAARPNVHQHYDSFAVERALVPIRRILLIDDVITKGRTLLAAAARLRAELPYTDIRAFALIRTQGFVHRIEHLVEPCHGLIRWAGGDARREP